VGLVCLCGACFDSA